MIFLAVLTAIVIGGLILLGAWILFVGGQFPMGIQQPQVQPQPQPQVQPQQAPPGRIQLQVQDALTGVALGGTNAKVDIIDPADLTKPKEIITVDTSTKIATSALFYSPGQTLLLHIYSTEGSGYYDQVYQVTVPSTYTLQANQYVYFLGAFGLRQRAAAASVSFTLFSGAAVLSSATGNAPDNTADLFNAGNKVVDLTLQINLQSYSTSFGRPVDYINARFEKVQLRAVAWLAFNNTAISTTALTAQGWNLVSTSAVTGWLVFYRVLDPVESSQTQLGAASIPIKFDATSIPTGKRVLVYVWVADLQNPADAAAGVGWTSLTPYGAHSGYGVTSPIGRVFQSSGGAPTAPLLQANIVVP
jgi:hypothetical protein